jgi:hypothetical protein
MGYVSAVCTIGSWRRVLPLLLIAALIGLGCGGSDDDETTGQPPAANPPASSDGGGKPPAYTISKQVCGAFPPEKVASDLGISVDTSTSEGIVSIAEAFSQQYTGPAQQDSFEGCLDGLPNP